MAHPRYVPTFEGMDHRRAVVTGAASVGAAMDNNRDSAGTNAEPISTPLTINIAAACARKSLLEKLPRLASISDMLTYVFHQALRTAELGEIQTWPSAPTEASRPSTVV